MTTPNNQGAAVTQGDEDLAYIRATLGIAAEGLEHVQIRSTAGEEIVVAVVQAFARHREEATWQAGWQGMTLPDVIRKANETLRLVEGCLECNADDERRWQETIKWLEGLA